MNDLINEDDVTLDESQEAEITEDQDVSDDDESQEDEPEALEAEGQGEDIDVDEGAGSQPLQANIGIRKRVRKITEKKDEALAGETKALAENATLKHRVELMQLMIDQQNGKAPEAEGPPDQLDFDDGAKDPKYVAAIEEYTTRLVDAQIQKRTASMPDPAVAAALEESQVAHYAAAENLNVKDYAETEALATKSFGQEAINHIIKGIPGSHRILYRLGKSPALSQELSSLIKVDPVAAVSRLTVLGMTKPTAKRNAAPDPDTELEGSSVARNSKSTRGPAGATFT